MGFFSKRLSKRAMMCLSVLLFEFLLLILVTIGSLVLKDGYQIPLMMLSLIALTALVFLCASMLLCVFDPNSRRRILSCSLITWCIGFFVFVTIVLCRNYVYEGDFTMYHNMQKEYFDLFELSPLKGFWGTIRSMWFSDYSYFMCIFLALPLKFTRFSYDAFSIVYGIIFGFPVCLAFNMLLEKIARRLPPLKYIARYALAEISFS